MNITVEKRKGYFEPFDSEKPLAHLKESCKDLNVSPYDVISNLHIRMKNKMKTSEIQRAIILTTADMIDVKHSDYQFMAARLELQDLYKRLYDSYEPVFNSETIKHRIKHGFYDGEIFDYYSEEEINELSRCINFENDLKFTYLGINQLLIKYSIKHKKHSIESPQEIFFTIPLYIFARIKDPIVRAEKIKTMYKKLSNFDIFLPTPSMVGIRTKMRGFTSCAIPHFGNSIESFGNASKTMYKLITKLRAGLGVNAGSIQGLGSKILGGQDEHTGIVPYLKVNEAISKSSTQPNSGRSGAITNYYPFFHIEIEDILQLKNNKGSEESSVRHSDHAIIFDKIVRERAENDEYISLFYMNEIGELYELIGTDKFKDAYEKLEDDPKVFKKKIKAQALKDRYYNERYTTSRVYKVNANAMQSHSAFNLPSYVSNLCVVGDTKIHIQTGEIEIKDVKVGDKVLSMNTETKKQEYKTVTAFAKTGINKRVVKITDEYGNNVICTPEHKIWTENRGYVKARHLFKNEILKLKNDVKALIKDIIVLDKSEDVYDITVEDNHNFYANEILVHNCTEINLVSFPDEDIYIKVRDKAEMDNFINDLYIEGVWYQLYRFLEYKVIDEENIKIVNLYQEMLSDTGNEYILNFGETASCILGGVNYGNLSLDTNERRAQLEESLDVLVYFLDELIDYQDYQKIKSFEKFTKNRRALGISPGNYFYMLAKHGFNYDTPEARNLTAKVSEEMLFYALKASNNLAKVKGKCFSYNDTKYSKGQLPIDTYEKNVDMLYDLSVHSKNPLDWDWLRQEIKIHGLTNSTLLTAVPSSNSSRPANMISGINPPQGVEYSIEDQKMKVIAILPKAQEYKEFYNYNTAWNLDVIKYWQLIAIIQKFTDQAISLNEYLDFTKYKDEKIPKSEVEKRDLFQDLFGVKTSYYLKTKTDEDAEELSQTESAEGCAGGGCTL